MRSRLRSTRALRGHDLCLCRADAPAGRSINPAVRAAARPTIKILRMASPWRGFTAETTRPGGRSRGPGHLIDPIDRIGEEVAARLGACGGGRGGRRLRRAVTAARPAEEIARAGALGARPRRARAAHPGTRTFAGGSRSGDRLAAPTGRRPGGRHLATRARTRP